jgi:predicted DNA-binding transcriptional regulator YafY
LLQRVDGSFDLIGSSDNLGGLARWILSFATDVRVVSPPVLRQNVHDLASAVVDLCESGGPDGPA